MSALEGRDVALYVEGGHELAVLEPIGVQLSRRGALVRTTDAFEEEAEIGLYACHGNRFFDYRIGEWKRPPNQLCALALHDFGQAGSLDAGYFLAEPWHAVDLGLLPGPQWARLWERAANGGARGPALGMHVIGWPKMDHVFASPTDFAVRVEALRASLGLGDRPVVVLACSWSDRRQLTDALGAIDSDVDLVVKYPSPEPPPQDSPWLQRLTLAYEELQRAHDMAQTDRRVFVASGGEDIMTLLASADVVLSNGSNVLYEGVLAGVPGVSVRDWEHPAGRYGEQHVVPHVDVSGVISGELDALPAMMRVVRDRSWAPLVSRGADSLVDAGTRGTAAARAADVIEAALVAGERERAGLRSANSTRGSELMQAAEQAQERETELDRATKQLQAYESEIERMRVALAAADEREQNARRQLGAYEQILAELREQPPS